MDKSPADVLDVIATADDQLIQLAGVVRRWPGVTRVDHALSLSPYRSPGDILLDIYVDAELSHGPGLVWSLGAWWRPEWGVEGSLRFVFGEDAEDVYRLAPRTSTDLDTFLLDLSQTVDELVGMAKRVDLATYLQRLPDPNCGEATSLTPRSRQDAATGS